MTWILRKLWRRLRRLLCMLKEMRNRPLLRMDLESITQLQRHPRFQRKSEDLKSINPESSTERLGRRCNPRIGNHTGMRRTRCVKTELSFRRGRIRLINVEKRETHLNQWNRKLTSRSCRNSLRKRMMILSLLPRLQRRILKRIRTKLISIRWHSQRY